MASFKVIFLPSAEAEFRAVPFPFRRQINQRIMSLIGDPLPSYRERLGESDKYRLPVHGWHVIYDWNEADGVVTIEVVSKD